MKREEEAEGGEGAGGRRRDKEVRGGKSGGIFF